MQFAIVANQPVQAGKDAPRYAQCIKCGKEVVRYGGGSVGYTWGHSDRGDKRKCMIKYAIAQRELDEALCTK